MGRRGGRGGDRGNGCSLGTVGKEEPVVGAHQGEGRRHAGEAQGGGGPGYSVHSPRYWARPISFRYKYPPHCVYFLFLSFICKFHFYYFLNFYNKFYTVLLYF
jgi:hypothetical protein